MLPDFIVIGAQRAGTTTLFEHLAHHPQIRPPTHKELHYFTLHHSHDLAWYRKHFPLAVPAAVAGRLWGPPVTGEATPAYLFHPHAAARVHCVLPDVKLIAILRNPVDRAFSHYQLNCIRACEDRDFDAAVEAERSPVEQGLERMRADPDVYDDRVMQFSYIARGHYADQLLSWKKLFRDEQLLVLRSEDLFSSPGEVVGRALQFLGLPPRPGISTARHGIRRDAPPMGAATRQELVEHFRGPNRDLQNLLGRDMGWDQ